MQRLEARVQAGELEAWKVALLREWAGMAPPESARPTLEQLTQLLADRAVMARLRKVQGPWEALTAQAGSHQAHREVGGALLVLGELLA